MTSDYFGKETPQLGFELMRLTKKGLHTDIEQEKHMGVSVKGIINTLKEIYVGNDEKFNDFV